MDNSDYLAAFRYGLIAPVVSRQTPFLPGERVGGPKAKEASTSPSFHAPKCAGNGCGTA